MHSQSAREAEYTRHDSQ